MLEAVKDVQHALQVLDVICYVVSKPRVVLCELKGLEGVSCMPCMPETVEVMSFVRWK